MICGAELEKLSKSSSNSQKKNYKSRHWIKHLNTYCNKIYVLLYLLIEKTNLSFRQQWHRCCMDVSKANDFLYTYPLSLTAVFSLMKQNSQTEKKNKCHLNKPGVFNFNCPSHFVWLNREDAKTFNIHISVCMWHCKKVLLLVAIFTMHI